MGWGNGRGVVVCVDGDAVRLVWELLSESRAFWPFLLRGMADRIEGDEGQPGPGCEVVSVEGFGEARRAVRGTRLRVWRLGDFEGRN